MLVCVYLWAMFLPFTLTLVTEQEREAEGKRGWNFEEGSRTNQGTDQET